MVSMTMMSHWDCDFYKLWMSMTAYDRLCMNHHETSWSGLQSVVVRRCYFTFSVFPPSLDENFFPNCSLDPLSCKGSRTTIWQSRSKKAGRQLRRDNRIGCKKTMSTACTLVQPCVLVNHATRWSWKNHCAPQPSCEKNSSPFSHGGGAGHWPTGGSFRRRVTLL